MLIASHITERDAGNAPSRHPLQVQWTSSPAEDLDGIPSRTDQPDRAVGDENLILINPRANVDLIMIGRLLERNAWTSIMPPILSVHDQSPATVRIVRNSFLGHAHERQWSLRRKNLTRT